MTSLSNLFAIWRPSLPESIDGKPLATNVADLFWDFPYERLPSNSLVAFTMRPDVVFALILGYLAAKRPLKNFAESSQFHKAPWFTRAVALHNLALAIYSFVTVLYAWPIFFQHWYRYGTFASVCDPHHTLWNDSGFGAWATAFYISKYYEFIDTWILIFKGKEPSFLQTFHHAGIVTIMWGAVASQSAWLANVVLLNSVIHTLMYSYFFIKTLYPKLQIKCIRYLTGAQIGQFITGNTCSLAVLVMGDECDSASSRFMLVGGQIYAYSLVGLFLAFARKKYKKS